VPPRAPPPASGKPLRDKRPAKSTATPRPAAHRQSAAGRPRPERKTSRIEVKPRRHSAPSKPPAKGKLGSRPAKAAGKTRQEKRSVSARSASQTSDAGGPGGFRSLGRAARQARRRAADADDPRPGAARHDFRPNNVELAANEDSITISADPKLVKSPASEARQTAAVLGL